MPFSECRRTIPSIGILCETRSAGGASCSRSVRSRARTALPPDCRPSAPLRERRGPHAAERFFSLRRHGSSSRATQDAPPAARDPLLRRRRACGSHHADSRCSRGAPPLPPAHSPRGGDPVSASRHANGVNRPHSVTAAPLTERRGSPSGGGGAGLPRGPTGAPVRTMAVRGGTACVECCASLLYGHQTYG
jgi:hypothetical protein